MGLNPGQTAVVVIAGYLVALIALGLLSQLVLRATVADYFVASRGLGSIMLLMSLIGTTMTAFALIGSSGEAWESGIVVYGKMASWSGIVHAAMYFLVGIKLWAFGKKYGYVTQIQFFRDRFESDKLGLLLFPILVGLLIPYVLLGVISSGTAIQSVTAGAFPSMFPNADAKLVGAVPYWLGALVTCLVVLYYISAGGVRGTAWVNALQTVIFLVLGVAACYTISEKLGGPVKATQMVMEYNPTRLKRDVTEADKKLYEEKLAAFNADPKAAIIKPKEPRAADKIEFLTYFFIPLSVAMFPHLFQYWLTARSAKKFRLSIIGQPLLIMVIWAPCVMIGIWATSAIMNNGQAVIPADFAKPNSVLPLIVKKLASPALGAFLAAGIFAAVMSSMDAQFLALGSMFTNDFVAHYARKDRFSEKQLVRIGRLFIVFIVAISYLLALALRDSRVFNLGVWCFSGFASLFPILFAAIYWRRVTKAGVYASILAASAVWLYLFREADFGQARTEPLHYGLTPVTFIFAAATIALVLVSLVTRPPSAATVEKFFTPRDGANERWGREAGG
jgi:solute:Na+ symporter, SSS family